jgi:hypothetical protein
VSICGIPLEVIKTEPGPERWCFGERKRRTGAWVLSGPSLETLMATEAWGWAEPVWKYVCDGCGEDHALGFGRVRVFEDEP